MEPISVTVDRTLADYVEAYSATFNLPLRLVLGVLFLGTAAWFIAEASHNADVVLGVFGGIEVACGAMTLYVVACNMWVTPRKMYAAHRRHSFQNYELTDEGIGISTDFGHSFTRWAGFAKVRETSHLWLLTFSNSLFYILPKRCVPADRLQEAKELLSRISAGSRETTRPG